jgi:hypothetical protein
VKREFCSYIIFFISVLCAFKAYAQETPGEHTGPLRYNAMVLGHGATYAHPLAKTTKKTAGLSLPFFEDFTGYNPLPDSSKWVDEEVYINNTMCVSPISRGVATMDALNKYGIPYDTIDNSSYLYCDSLTSQPIDLTPYTPGDSLYLSFFYQPQGNGFYPLEGDSLYFYMRKSYADWTLVWSTPGNTLQPFQQVMIPITDTNYLYDTFQFRFVNLAALDFSDAVWNIDYIRLYAGRNMYDTAVNDLAFSSDPTFFLNDYTSMPYRQFMANPSAERATQYSDSLHNNWMIAQQVAYGDTAYELTTNTSLYSSGGPVSNAVAAPMQIQQLSTSAYTNTIPLTGNYNNVVYENKFYFQSVGITDPSANDTIVKDQIFDNYLAYDDGTAEQSYYLTQYTTLPAYLAIEFHLNQADTLQGLAIYFGRQAPPPTYKYFSIVIYSSLDGVNGGTANNILLQEDDVVPGYIDTINHFWIYSFSTPIPLPAGLFYAGYIQPAYGGADSLYIGLDVNRIGTNHAYFNVQNSWSASQISGALMIRPLLGQPVAGTGIKNVNIQKQDWTLSPNPASNTLLLDYNSNAKAAYSITDILGRNILNAGVDNAHTVDVSLLSPGMYFMTLYLDGVAADTKKFIKQ